MLGAMVGVVRNGRTKKRKRQGGLFCSYDKSLRKQNRRALGRYCSYVHTIQPRVSDGTIYVFRRVLKKTIVIQ